MSESRNDWNRRTVIRALSAAGVGSAVMARALAAAVQEAGRATPAMIRDAEWIAGLELTDDDRALMANGVNEALDSYVKLRAVELDNAVAPALRYTPVLPDRAGREAAEAKRSERAHGRSRRNGRMRPASTTDLAYAGVAELSELLRTRQVSSTELTRLCLDRLSEHDATLHCVITPTPELALAQAEAADREIAAGRYRGPLHGIPWGAKDLIAVPGYATTWGAAPYREQVREETATVAARLAEAGAVLVAKLSVGALAWGDVWFGGKTRNPWKPEQGSSGSSAGPAAATASGLVSFAIGTETWGSIVSPCTRCGVTGLRPTFGRVSRAGVMALSWSMDKIGPIARSVEDCALVFDAIRGSDGRDGTVLDRPFAWPPERDPTSLRMGYVPSDFDDPAPVEEEDEEARAQRLRRAEWASYDRRSLSVLRDLGFELVPVEPPSKYPVDALSFILNAEAAAAFDELTRSGRDDLMVRQEEFAWPNVFRHSQFIPAVEYIRANRIRSLVLREMEALMDTVDVLVTPTFAGDHLLLTNLTGHPSVVLPNGFRSGDGTPTSLTFTGGLFGESDLLAVARAYQEATDFHLARPPLYA
ncbi:MAG: amidase [Gemmatimonadota bacterium]